MYAYVNVIPPNLSWTVSYFTVYLSNLTIWLFFLLRTPTFSLKESSLWLLFGGCKLLASWGFGVIINWVTESYLIQALRVHNKHLWSQSWLLSEEEWAAHTMWINRTKEHVRSWAGPSRAVQDFIALLRMGFKLTLMNCLFLSFFV